MYECRTDQDGMNAGVNEEKRAVVWTVVSVKGSRFKGVGCVLGDENSRDLNLERFCEEEATFVKSIESNESRRASPLSAYRPGKCARTRCVFYNKICKPSSKAIYGRCQTHRGSFACIMTQASTRI